MSLADIWKQQYEDNNTKINQTINSIDQLKRVSDLIENNKNQLRYSDIWRRWQNKKSQQRRKQYLGEYSQDLLEAPTRPREPNDIDVGVERGRATYTKYDDENKWVESFAAPNGKSNYVYAYKNFSKLQVGVVDQQEVESGASLGFNVGQIAGEEYWLSNPNYAVVEDIWSSWQKKYYGEGKIDEEIREIQQSFYEAILPGITRIPITWRYRVSLADLLEQNQARPFGGRFDTELSFKLKGTIDRKFKGFNTGSADITRSWTVLYRKDSLSTDEDLRRGTDSIFPKGHISRNDVIELQEPRHNNLGEPIDGTGVIRYENDAKYNTYDSRKRGFYSNILGNVRVGDGDVASKEGTPQDGGALLPAVEQIKNPTKLNSEASSFGQYFPFMFETVNRSIDPITGNTKLQVYEQYAYFQATLSQLSEQFAPNWNTTHFAGRTEEVHTYQKNSRTVDIRFVIFANSAREQQNVYERVNWLAQQTYPLYDENPAKMSGGPIIRITIGDLFKQVAGFIRSLSYNWDFLGANKWEIEPGLRMPMACEVSMQFQVIHDFMPHRDFNFYGGLEDKMITGSLYGEVDVANIPAEKFKLDALAWTNETNLIPTTPSDPSDPSSETFVTLLGRKNIVNTGIEPIELTPANGTEERTYMPGQSLSYADFQASLVSQVGENDRPAERAG